MGTTRPEPIEVPRLTSAPLALSARQTIRMRRYLLQMSIRVVCFVIAVFLAPNPWAWLAIIGAVLLPYCAVIDANAGAERGEAPTNPYEARAIAAAEYSSHKDAS